MSFDGKSKSIPYAIYATTFHSVYRSWILSVMYSCLAGNL